MSQSYVFLGSNSRSDWDRTLWSVGLQILHHCRKYNSSKHQWNYGYRLFCWLLLTKLIDKVLVWAAKLDTLCHTIGSDLSEVNSNVCCNRCDKRHPLCYLCCFLNPIPTPPSDKGDVLPLLTEFFYVLLTHYNFSTTSSITYQKVTRKPVFRKKIFIKKLKIPWLSLKCVAIALFLIQRKRCSHPSRITA